MDIACVWLAIIFMKLFTKQQASRSPMKTSIPKWRECGSAARIRRRFQRDIVFAHPYKPHAISRYVRQAGAILGRRV